MHPGADLLDLSILYDTARRFLRLRERDEQIHYTLLSLVGATGASSATWLERDEEDRFAPRARRGPEAKPAPPIPATRKLEHGLLSREPVRGEEIAKLGAALARYSRESGAEVFLGLGPRGRVDAIVTLGAKLFGEAWEDREIALAAELAKLASVSLFPDAGPDRPRSGDLAGPARVEEMRQRFPALEAFRGEGSPTIALFEELSALADFDLPVLILGETGTGKELVAQAIHELSPRRRGSFEAINCAAIPSDLMASALFGHEQGAFTGAVSRVRGAFERAGTGTIFLDEIGDMPAETQANLLRVLQERSFRRVGGETTIPARARVISATNRDLLQEVEKGTFRADLFYRLQMYSIRIPPLRERPEEIPTLAAHVLERHGGAKPPRLSTPFLDAISRRELRGNVRELESLIVGAMIRAGGAKDLRPEHLPPESKLHPDTARPEGSPEPAGGSEAPPFPRAAPIVPAMDEAAVPSYETMERLYIRSVLKLTEGNKKEAAQLMGIPRTTLNARIKKLGLAVIRSR